MSAVASARSSSARSATWSSGTTSTPTPPSRCTSPARSFLAAIPVVQQLNAALLFALGFIVRPIGGWLFGHLADHYGRQNSLMLSVLLMCFGSLMIAVTPTYASIGVAAPVMLGVATHASGPQPRRRIRHQRHLPERGRRPEASRLLFELPVRHADRRPALRDSSSCCCCSRSSSPTISCSAWGWRIPFVIGALLARHRAADAAQPARDRRTSWRPRRSRPATRESSLKALMRYPREVLMVVGLTMGGTTAFYTYTTYMQKFLKLSVGLTDNADDDGDGRVAALRADPAADLRRALRPHRPKAAADLVRRHRHRLSRFRCSTRCSPRRARFVAFLLIAAAWLIVAGYTSINAVVKAELFPDARCAPPASACPMPSPCRSSAARPSRSRCGSSRSATRQWFYFYLTGVIATSLLVYVSMRDTKHYSAMDRHE